VDLEKVKELSKKYEAWIIEMRKKYLAHSSFDAFIAGYELGSKEKEHDKGSDVVVEASGR
jgi:hypothetical protein